MSYYVIKDAGQVVAWGECDPSNFSGGLPAGLEWVDVSHVADPIVPTAVSARQFRMALTRINMRTTVEEAIAAADQDTKDWYEFSNEFQRGHPLLNSMAVSMGKTGAEIDALFQLAVTL